MLRQFTAVIVDDHLLLAETLSAALGQRGINATFLAPAEPEQLLDSLLFRRPDLVLLDLDLRPFGDSTRLIAPLVGAGIKVLMVTGVQDRLRIAATLEQGAIGYQPKADGFDALLDATSAALRCTTALDPAGRILLKRELAASRSAHTRLMEPFSHLTEREAETLRALGAGRTVRKIAKDWVVSEATIRTHVHAILRKLDAPSQLAAVLAATNSGWLAESNETTAATKARFARRGDPPEH